MSVLVMIVLAGFFVLAAVFAAPRLYTAWTAESTLRRISVWHAENAREADGVECERRLFAVWENEFGGAA